MASWLWFVTSSSGKKSNALQGAVATVSLSLAISVSTRSIVHSTVGTLLLFGIAAASLFCCLLQFFLGKRIGAYYDRKVSNIGPI